MYVLNRVVINLNLPCRMSASFLKSGKDKSKLMRLDFKYLHIL